MGKREDALAARKVQFAMLVLLVVASVAILASSDIGKGSIFGIPMRAVLGLAGMLLIVVVVFAGAKIMFSNLPQDGSEEKDLVSDAANFASPRALERLAEIKYSQGRKARKAGFDEYYRVKK